uniref:N-acetyltransferase domain-containing protein n=1 Tax=viral metagenome TaxID=1070528 RepID=A0A6C0AC42_9ZZZZ
MLKIYALDDCPIKHLVPLQKSPKKGISLVSFNKNNVVRFVWRLYYHIDGSNELADFHIHQELKDKLNNKDEKFADRYIQRCLFIYANTFKLDKMWVWTTNKQEYFIDLYERNGFKKVQIDRPKEKKIRKNNPDLDYNEKVIKYEIDLSHYL